MQRRGKNHPTAGFTLIELLVVIAIIGLLSSVVLASLSQARSRSRDARRLADMKQVQAALELYYSQNNRYPSDNRPSYTVDSLSAVLSPNLIPVVPSDPSRTGASGYRYCASPVGTESVYTLLIQPEDSDISSGQTWCKVTTAPSLTAACWGSMVTYPMCNF